MFAIGLLSLLGVGIAVSMGGDDSVDETGSVADTTSARLDSDDSTQGDLLIDFVPAEDIDPETEALINEFVSDIEDQPDLSIEEGVDELQAFLDELAALQGLEDDAAETGADVTATSDETEEAVARPPVGAGFNDPIIINDALEAQRLLDELAEIEARQPENLVSVTNGFGLEVDDDDVLNTQLGNDPTGGPDENGIGGDYAITAPDGPNSIEVAYDPDTNFEITYNAETSAVTASLNSEISGPAPEVSTDPARVLGDDGELIDRTTTSETYAGSTDITINVDQAQVGAGMAQIDLTNPADALHFEFDGDVEGNLHYITVASDESSGMTVERAYIIHTPSGIDELSDRDIANIVSAQDGLYAGASVLAEVYLGQESVSLIPAATEDDLDELIITDQLNEDPAITANIDWAWTYRLDQTSDDAGATGGGSADGGFNIGVADAGNGVNPFDPVGGEGADGSEGDAEDEIADLFEDIGINPGFFGF
ncbi:MAG: hypothetical protein AAF307_09220 [Pseudomonadota bacterium]